VSMHNRSCSHGSSRFLTTAKEDQDCVER
jgi:hypothetical protein